MLVVYISIGLLLTSQVSCFEEDDRIMGWNKAHGLWGKRSYSDDETFFNSQQKRPVQNWNKLNSLWGKRSDALMEELEKRSAQWQRANGLWGRK